MPGSPPPTDSTAPGNTPKQQPSATQLLQVISGGQSKIRNRSPIGRPLKPVIKVGKGPRKKVQFAADVVDNEYKMKPRPDHGSRGRQDELKLGLLEPRQYMEPAVPQDEVIKPEANKPVKRDPGPVKNPPLIYRRKKISSGHSRDVKPSPPASYKRRTIPPAVPDPPTPIASRPPPAPGPARLPSPDLPEIDGATMFPPLALGKFREEFNLLKRPAHQKMDAQLDAAKAFIAESRKRGERLHKSD